MIISDMPIMTADFRAEPGLAILMPEISGICSVGVGPRAGNQDEADWKIFLMFFPTCSEEETLPKASRLKKMSAERIFIWM